MADIPPTGHRAVDVEIIADDAPIGAETSVDVVGEDGAGGLPKRAVQLADGSVRLTLAYPVTLAYRSGPDAPVKEEHYEALTFRRLLGADMRAISATADDSKAVVAIARSAGVREGLMHRLYDRMDGSDIKAAGDVVGYFLGAGRTSGR